MRLVDLAKKYPTMRHILKRNRKYELRREKAQSSAQGKRPLEIDSPSF